ncbi:MAG: hypothetical protein ACK5QC_00225 [Bacteroidota bacterium]|jgi:hypothetical protein
MKKQILMLLVLLSFSGKSQLTLYKQIKDAISIENPKISFDDKLVAINIWQANDIESRNANKEFDKVYKTYEFAKLKGGLKGVVVANVNLTDQTASILLKKDGIEKLITISINTNELQGKKNIVFNSNGDKVLENIPSADVFKSFINLITR